jgi:hypothetical protein
MKILIPLLLLTLGVNANEVVYGSKSGNLTEASELSEFQSKAATLLELQEGELFELLGATGAGITTAGFPVGRLTMTLMTQHANQQPAKFVEGYGLPFNLSPEAAFSVVGPCKLLVATSWARDSGSIDWQVSYKITKPSAAGTTTSAPILLPPTQDAAKSWFVKLQVSSDLKAWDDVAPGQFLGSDTARFFRIQTTEAE